MLKPRDSGGFRVQGLEFRGSGFRAYWSSPGTAVCGDLQTCCLLLDLRMLNVPRVSIVVPFLVNQVYGQDLVIEILVNRKKELQWRL